MMSAIIFLNTSQKKMGIVMLLISAMLLAAAPTFGHGGKTHADGSFTPLQALQKATRMYDRLVVEKKLDERWETALETVEIFIRKQNGKKEFMVSFHRLEGSPQTVYFFFGPDGKYSGSNFTGQ